MRIDVKVIPRASSTEIVGWSENILRVRVRAAPEGGKANSAVAELLANLLGIPAASVRVVVGHTSSRKIVEILGCEDDVVRRVLVSGR